MQIYSAVPLMEVGQEQPPTGFTAVALKPQRVSLSDFVARKVLPEALGYPLMRVTKPSTQGGGAVIFQRWN